MLGAFSLFFVISQVCSQEPTGQATQPAGEQSPATPAQGHSIHGEAFDEGPRQSAILLTGMGDVTFPVTTQSPEAQAFISQGVAQLHTFYYLESERSFRQAAALDPDCPMAYWGMAMANVNNAKRAKIFLKEAETRAQKHAPSRRETLYLESLSGLYGADGDDKSKRRKQLETLETLVQEFPADPDARCWLALLTWQNADKDGIGSRQAVEELISSVERISPMHPAVHHYRIHLWDGVKPALAQKSARLYALAAPGIAHAWHMPGHTYSGLKHYADAAFQQEGSARVDHLSMNRTWTMPFDIHNYAHNNQWLSTSLSHLGQVRKATGVARNLVEQPRDPQKNTPADGGSAQSNGRARWSEALTRYEFWDQLLEVTLNGNLDWSDLPRDRKEKAYTLGLAYAAKSDLTQLRTQIDALKQLEPPKPPPEPEQKPAPSPGEAQANAEKKPAEAPKPDEKKPAEAPKPDEKKPAEAPKPDDKKPAEAPKPEAPPGLSEAIAELEGYLLLLTGQSEEALKSFEKAGSMRPESKARMQLRAGKPDLAIQTAKAAVDQNQNQLAPQLAYIEILEATDKPTEAQAAYDQAKPLIQNADADLPALTRVNALRARQQHANPKPASSQPVNSDSRPALDYLGPLHWQPTPAPLIELTDTEGVTWRLSEHLGRNVVVLFFLGGSCAHCMQQLQEFTKESTEFSALDTDLIAISTDQVSVTQELKHNQAGIQFSMPILADPELNVFKRFYSHDDFENRPMHGTFFIDRAGKIRFQRISAEPFLDLSFLKQEIRRINRIARTTP